MQEKLPITTSEVYAYVRVSSKDQEREGNSIPAQRDLITAWAERNKLIIKKWYEDIESAKSAGRKNFERMVADFMALPEDRRILAVEKIDRFTRNQEDAVTLKNLNATLIFIKQGLIINKESRSSDLLNYDINVAFSRFYINNLSEEVKKGQLQKIKEGVYPSWAPIGYKNVHLDSGKNDIKPDLESGPYIKKLFELYATGEFSLQKLLPVANSYGLHGIRLKGKLTKEGLRRILSNPLYYGAFRWKSQLYQGKHEPVVTKGLFDRVQSILRNGDRVRPQKNFFAFKGLLRCRECHCQITAERHTKKSGISFIYYHCTHTKYSNHKQQARCSTGYWSEAKLSETLGQTVLHPLAFPKEILEYCKETLTGTRQEDEKFNADQITDLKRKLISLKRYQDVAYEDKVRGILSESDWLYKHNGWKNLEFDYKAKIDKLESKKTDCNLQAYRILELTQDVEALYLTLPIDKKAELLKIVSSNSELDAVSVYPIYKKPWDILSRGLDIFKWRVGRGSNS
jgi:Site-specific recombinases, DNA invertase Pin homologs